MAQTTRGQSEIFPKEKSISRTEREHKEKKIGDGNPFLCVQSEAILSRVCIAYQPQGPLVNETLRTYHIWHNSFHQRNG